MTAWKRLHCRLFGHRRWYYPDGLDLVLACERCRDLATEVDRVRAIPHPDRPGWLLVDKAALMRGFLHGVSS